MQITSLNSVSNSLSYDIVMFKIEVGVDAKCTVKTRKMATAACNIACSSNLLQPVAIHDGPDTTHTVGIVRSVDIHATARYSKICRSVCVCVCVFVGKCTVAKRLSESGCHLGS